MDSVKLDKDINTTLYSRPSIHPPVAIDFHNQHETNTDYHSTAIPLDPDNMHCHQMPLHQTRWTMTIIESLISLLHHISFDAWHWMLFKGYHHHRPYSIQHCYLNKTPLRVFILQKASVRPARHIYTCWWRNGIHTQQPFNGKIIIMARTRLL